MKNIIKFASAMLLILIIIIFVFMCFSFNKIPENQILVRINKCEIEKCNSKHIEYESTLGYDLPKNISENIDKYWVIKMQYYIENDSNKKMEDIRCHPIFSSKLKVETYNSGNGTYYIDIEPNNSSGFNQYIFIKGEDLNAETIYEEVLDEQIELTFYTDSWTNFLRKNTGHGLEGLGKNVYKFTVRNLVG